MIAPFKLRPAALARHNGCRGHRLLAGLGMVLFTLATAGIGCTAADQRTRSAEADLAALPPKVREALDRAARVYAQPLGGASWSKVYLMKGTDHPLYQLQGTNERGNKVEIEVAGAGRVIEVEEHGIPIGEVPAAVTDALKGRMPDFTPTKVEAIYQAENGQPVSYGFEAPDAAGRVIEVYISADGKAVLN
jgi:hypothetical protein